MKLIPLGGKYGKGKFVKIDDEDYSYLCKFGWSLYKSNGYVRRFPDMLMHREIMNTPKGMDTDHINRDRLDNRRCNLRICTRAQNMHNRAKRKIPTSSKYIGVSKSFSRWATNINKDGELVTIGRFNTEIQAAMAYDLWAKDLRGEYVELNFK